MPYPYEQIFAADESSPEKVASNGVVTIFAPGDPDRTPLTITTLDGLPLSNPIQVNDAGFGPAFMHATLDQVAWAGGGLSGLFVSYQGMKDEAVAARRAAEAAVSEVQAPTDASVDRGIQRADIPGRVAAQIADGPIMASVVAGYTKSSGNPVNAAVRGLVSASTTTLLATPENFTAIDNTGARDTAMALQQVFDAAPAGSVVVLVGKYLLRSTVNIDPAKFLRIDCSGATLVSDTGGTMLRCAGTFGATSKITNISTEQVVVENSKVTLTKLTLASSPDWSTGDVVKVIANDVIPAAHVTSITLKPRVGEFMTVHSVSGAAVYLKGQLTEPFTQNPRAAKLIPGSVDLIRPTFDVTDERLAVPTIGTMFRAQSLISPRVVFPTMRRLVGIGISMKSNLGYSIDGPESFTGVDNTDAGILSYSLHDSGCVDGRVFGGTLRGGRHAYTDGSAEIPVDHPDVADYGATLNPKLIGTTAREMTAACFDTHHNSRGVEFIDCTAYPQPEQDGFLLRGRDHRVVNPTQHGGRSMVSLITQVSGAWSQGETRGHELINPRSYGTQRVVTGAIRTSPNHPSVGMRDSRNLVVHGGYHAGLRRVALLENTEVIWKSGSEIGIGPLAEGAFFETKNSALIGDSISIDASEVVTIAAIGIQRVLFANDSEMGRGSDVRLFRMRIKASSTYRAASPIPFESTANAERIHIEALQFENAWDATNPFVIPATVKQSVTWSVVPVDEAGSFTFRSSRHVQFTNNQLTTGEFMPLFRSTDENLLMFCGITDATARTLAPLPRGKYTGQRLRILLSSASGALTLVNGVGNMLGLVGSSNKALATTNDQVSLVWSGSIWRQENNVV